MSLEKLSKRSASKSRKLLLKKCHKNIDLKAEYFYGI